MSTPSGVFTLQQIMETDYPRPPAIIKNLLSPGEIALFIARQKEGKSTLALQLAIDVACGNPFLDKYETTAGPVLYVDYENRLARIKDRGLDLANGRAVTQLHIKAFDLMSQRDVGLFGADHANLRNCVREIAPHLLFIDPLRYALAKGQNKSTAEENLALAAIEQVSALREVRSELATVLVHHVKKRQDFSQKAIKLREEPRSWIEQVYGSQALLAHVDTIWGLEEDGDGYVFATVPRSQDPIILRFEKQPDSERFLPSSTDVFAFKTPVQRDAWDRLPDEFGWREVTKKTGISNNVLDRVTRQARAAGLLIQDPVSKKFRKVKQRD